MARVNINTLGINELKWMGMGEFNSDDHYIFNIYHVVLIDENLHLVLESQTSPQDDS